MTAKTGYLILTHGKGKDAITEVHVDTVDEQGRPIRKVFRFKGEPLP